MTEEDLNYIAKVEQAIESKYGEEAIQNPKADWSEEKEKEYLKQAKKLYQRERKIQEGGDKVEVNGFLISKKLLNRDSERLCLVCETYSFEKRDDLYMTKYDCCFSCYIEWVENREERWQTGWRPSRENASKRIW
jgi:hypothetical protein